MWDVSGYKSIRDDQTIPIKNSNVFVGANNTGKSSIIDAIRDYQSVFPEGRDKDGSWVQKRITEKVISGELKFNFMFMLDEEKRKQLLSSLEILSESEAERYSEQYECFLRYINHELVLSPGGKNASSRSTVYTFFDGEQVKICNRVFDNSPTGNPDSEYLKFNKLPDIEYTSRNREWLKIHENMENSIDSWVFVDAFRSPKNRMPAEESLQLDDEAENLSQVLLTLAGEKDGRFKQISEIYSEVMNGIEGLSAPLRSDEATVVVKEEGLDAEFELEDISAGSKEILILITQIVLSQGHSDMILIEEPELHLHPGAQRKILDNIDEMFFQKSDGPQVLISTHSSVFLNHKVIDNVVRVERDTYSVLKQATPDERGSDIQDLGYTYSGVFQSDAVVIVEGRTDKKVFRILGEKYGINLKEERIGLVDMECRSKMINHSRSIVKLLSVFDIPYLFICDSDSDPMREVRGTILDKINRTGDGNNEDVTIWWDKADRDNVCVWCESEIEEYLLHDIDKIAGALDTDPEQVAEILSEHESASPEEKLEAICQQARPYVDEGEKALEKDRDVPMIAEEVRIEELPEEFHSVMERIASLIGAEQKVKENRPDT